MTFYLVFSWSWYDLESEDQTTKVFKNTFLNISKVVIAWSRLAGMKFYPTLPGSRQGYKLFINYILRLHVKRFIPARRDLSFVQPGSCFAGTKFSHVIVSARLGGIKKLIIEDISIVSLRLDGLKFHPGKPGSCNHHLRQTIQINLTNVNLLLTL